MKNLKKVILSSTLLFLTFVGCKLDGIYPVNPVPTPTPIITITPSSTPSTSSTPSPTPTFSITPTPTLTSLPSPSPTSSDDNWYEVFFSKTDQEALDNIDIKLIEKINSANKSIKIAVFELDSSTIVDALINAYKRE
ncbi:MAG: hypothetical protein KatS3mg068_2602 [Candidatus Sericytochromatia bacterium]|nr:MAG: hypothetical protein KatS3mg068_2602 [Candidatus Sericytochromatia bacterium]